MEKADIMVPLFLLQGGRKFGVLRSERIAYGHTWISKADAAGLPGQGGVHIVFGNLVQHPEWEPVIPEEEIFAVLEKRRGVLDGVCVTGGEPTLDPDLERFVTKIKELGYLVKLDTNGYRPEILKKLVEEKKIDYVAMDIKNAPSRYGETAGVKKIDVMRINESVEFLKSGVVDYEFRTTLCKELHGREEIEAIGKWLSGAKRYFLQNYRESDYVIDPRFSGYAREQLERFCEILRGKIETVEIRGVD